MPELNSAKNENVEQNSKGWSSCTLIRSKPLISTKKQLKFREINKHKIRFCIRQCRLYLQWAAEGLLINFSADTSAYNAEELNLHTVNYGSSSL